jgi:hypothetical protein
LILDENNRLSGFIDIIRDILLVGGQTFNGLTAVDFDDGSGCFLDSNMGNLICRESLSKKKPQIEK